MSKSEELRAAAKLLVAKESIANRYDNAGVRLAKAYLAEHPVDEDEPVTREWLLSVGFREIGAECKQMVICLGPGACNWLSIDEDGYVSVQADGAGQGRLAIGSLKARTRSDVRRLCAALGISVKDINRIAD
jgi:hypothetical protein